MDLAKFALVLFASVCAVCVIMGGIVLTTAFRRDPKAAADSVRAFFEGNNALRVATVLAVLGTMTVLTFASRMTEGILTLMSGIVGYVLGGLSRSTKTRSEPSGDGVRASRERT